MSAQNRKPGRAGLGAPGPAAARRRPPVFLGLLAALGPGLLAAHDPGLSAILVEVGSAEISATITVSRADLDTVPQDLAAALEVAFDGRAEKPVRTESGEDGKGELRLSRSFRRVAASRLRVRSALLAGLPPGHRQWISIRGSDGRRILERLLHAGDPACEADLGAPAPAADGSFAGFLLLGAEHVLTGYDHLAFLLGLLLAGGTLAAAAKVITAFSAAHSLTLALSALGLVSLPPRVVEPLIAASVVYVGLENLFRKNPPPRRWLLSFGFGLVHGLGFASALEDTGALAGGSLAAALLSFNLGVELAQVAIAIPLLPLLARLRAGTAGRARLCAAVSAALALAGAWWLWERLAGGGPGGFWS